MKVDYSKFEHGVNLHGKIVIEEDSNKEITAQLQPDDNGEIPDVEKKTLEFFLDNYSEYKQFLLDHIFEYYKDCRDEWGITEPDDELFPEVKDKNKMYEMASLRGLMVFDEAYSGKQTITLFYDCTWDEEEGMGIRIALGNNVSEVKVVKIATIGGVY
ncbi:hypothetical protein [Ruminococcus sp.]|uniref:DUF6985 domain-containing protein n=1 Tax=Ruminococcus sp. TaxID=41978 RepID=UPI0025F20313|nr:hypothetical protein [Ruminococcus sp.]MBQ8965400.1 hypothetical protein [Ruminococcus sp.]